MRHGFTRADALLRLCRSGSGLSTAAATALLPALGYERVGELARASAETGRTIRDLVITKGWLSVEAFDELISPEAVCRLGLPDVPRTADGPASAAR